MELLQLQYFYESSKNENFAKTAEKYIVPTSSVSASVKRLEKELGCDLFDRTCNRIILNNNGKRLQQALCTVFTELSHAVEDLSAANKDHREIKMLVRAMRSDITDYIISYSKKYPHISFKTAFDFGEHDFEKYDIIIDEKADAYPNYQSFELCNIQLCLKVASASPLCGKKLTLKQLCNQSFISLDEESNMHKILMKACKNAGFSPNIVVQSNDMKCHEKLLESGIGIGLERHDVSRDRTRNLCSLEVTDFNETYGVYCYYKTQAAYGNVEHFLTYLKNRAKGFV